MGQGYRLVAASSGVLADEKREIVQRAPSHGNLCEESSKAWGLASFELRSGRHCLFFCRSAGIEHTGRGGFRVYTHILIMTRGEFELLGSDPFEVERAVPPGLCDEFLREPVVHLAQLRLQPLPEPLSSPPETLILQNHSDLQRLKTVLTALLDSYRLFLFGAPLEAFRLIWDLSPPHMRPLSASYGLKWSPSRPFQLVCIGGPPTGTEQTACEEEVQVLNWQSMPVVDRAPAHDWLQFVERMWNMGRRRELRRLRAQTPGPVDVCVLNEIATLCEDIERMGRADSALVETLLERYIKVAPLFEVHGRLLDEACLAGELRRSALACSEHTMNQSPAD
jgi:hypothetical protein